MAGGKYTYSQTAIFSKERNPPTIRKKKKWELSEYYEPRQEGDDRRATSAQTMRETKRLT